MGSKKVLVILVAVVSVLAFGVYTSTKSDTSSPQTEKITQVDETEVTAALQKAHTFTQQSKWLEAKEIYRAISETYAETDYGQIAFGKLNEIGLRAYFQGLTEENSSVYTVKVGDNLTKIASFYGVTPGTVQITNRLKSDRIRPGQRLTIMHEAWSIVVDKSQNILILKAGENIVRQYQVATGTDKSTPAGDFKIVNRLVDPTWYYEGVVAPAGSPDNPLGTRWLGFDLEGYGLHGTTNPDQIGEYATLGCVRMHNHDIEEVFELVPVGTVVSVIE